MEEPSVPPHRVTQLLTEWSHGDNAALAELTPLVYEELRRLAHHYMEGQRSNHTLQTTALVNEAYLRLADQTNPNWQSSHALAGQGLRVLGQNCWARLWDHSPAVVGLAQANCCCGA